MLYMIISTLFFSPFLLLFIVVLKWYNFTFFVLYRAWAWSICIATGIIPWIKGKSNIPKNQPFVLVSNHTSQLDIVVPYTLIYPHFAFLAKAELKKAPLFNINFKGMNVTVDRRSSVSGSASLHECADKLKAGISMHIFPEGTRSRTAPVMRPFKQGPFRLAIDNQTPIVPMVFLDNYKRLEGGAGIWGKCGVGMSRMIVLEPISTIGMDKSHVEELMEQTRLLMENTLKSYQVI